MGNTTSLTRNQNHDDNACSWKRVKTCDNSGATPWSDLNHDVLFVVMMKLGVVDFVAFSGVCKSWRSLALSNKKTFMASRPPMLMWSSNYGYKNEWYLEDIEGRKFKTILPHFAGTGRTCVGLTCGYLIFFWKKLKTRDFWIVNPITRHELHFPNVPIEVGNDPSMIKAIIVFSPSISGWVFIMLDKCTDIVCFCIAGKEAWSHVSTTFPILDLHAFMGKIYTITTGCRVFEMRLNPELKLTLLEIKNCMEPFFVDSEFVSSGEILHVINYGSQDGLDDTFMVQELDFSEMEWVMPKKTIEKYAFFISNLNDSVVIKPKPWADPRSQYKKIVYFPDESKKCRFFIANMWYFPHECLDVNLIDE